MLAILMQTNKQNWKIIILRKQSNVLQITSCQLFQHSEKATNISHHLTRSPSFRTLIFVQLLTTTNSSAKRQKIYNCSTEMFHWQHQGKLLLPKEMILRAGGKQSTQPPLGASLGLRKSPSGSSLSLYICQVLGYVIY